MSLKSQNRIFHLIKKIGDRAGIDLLYFFKNGFWIAIRQVTFLLSGLAFSVIFARLVDKEVVGFYQLIFSVFAILSFFSIPGLNYALMQSVARGFDGGYENLAKTRFRWSLFGSLGLLLFGLYYKDNSIVFVSFIVSAVFFPLFYSYNSWDGFLQGKEKFNVVSIYYIFLLLFNSLFSILVIFYFRESLILIISAYLFSYTFLNIYFYKKSLGYVQNNKKDKNLLQYGKKLTKANSFVIISDGFDKIILGLINPASLAIYYFVSLLIFRIKDIVIPVFNIIIPKLSISNSKLVDLIKNKRAAFISLFLSLVLISAVFYLNIEMVNKFLFGESYAEYYFYSKYYVFFIFFYLPVSFLTKYCQAKKMDGIILLSDSTYAILKILLSIILIYKYDIIGAIIAYNVSVFIWFIFYLAGILWTERGVTFFLKPEGQDDQKKERKS